MLFERLMYLNAKTHVNHTLGRKEYYYKKKKKNNYFEKRQNAWKLPYMEKRKDITRNII